MIMLMMVFATIAMAAVVMAAVVMAGPKARAILILGSALALSFAAVAGSHIGSGNSKVSLAFFDDLTPTIQVDPVEPKIALLNCSSGTPIILKAVHSPAAGWQVDLSALIQDNVHVCGAGFSPGGPTDVYVAGTATATLDCVPFWVSLPETEVSLLSGKKLRAGNAAAALTLRALWADGQFATGSVESTLASQLSLVTLSD